MDLLVALLLAGSFFLIVYFIRESNRVRLAAMPAAAAATAPRDGAGLYCGMRRFTAGLTFISVWAVYAMKFGFFFGAVLGWLPAAIVAYFVGLLWPVAATGLFLFLAAIIVLAHGS